MTDFSEQPDTPGPQPRQGAKAADVPVMEKMEFSSKSPGFRPDVLACTVESGKASPEAAALLDAVAELEGSEPELAAEPPQPTRALQAMAAHSTSERMRVYFNFIAVSSLKNCGRKAAAASQNDTP